MIKSMTGFAHKEISQNNYEVTIDIRSLNHRYSEINIRIPQELNPFEEEIRRIIGERVSRGKIDIQIKVKYLNKERFKIVINRDAVNEIISEFDRVKDELELSGKVDINSLLLVPHVIEFEPTDTEVEPEFLKLIKQLLESALEALEDSRKKEGKVLCKVIEDELTVINKQINKIEELLPTVKKEHYSKLKQKIQEYVNDIPIDENRLIQEVAYLVERSDITEEINRVKSHLEQTQQQLDSDKPVGRHLDFLMQELFREVSTMGAKCRNSLLVPEVLAMRASIEKIRQQVQNIE